MMYAVSFNSGASYTVDATIPTLAIEFAEDCREFDLQYGEPDTDYLKLRSNE